MSLFNLLMALKLLSNVLMTSTFSKQQKRQVLIFLRHVRQVLALPVLANSFLAPLTTKNSRSLMMINNQKVGFSLALLIPQVIV